MSMSFAICRLLKEFDLHLILDCPYVVQVCESNNIGSKVWVRHYQSMWDYIDFALETLGIEKLCLLFAIFLECWMSHNFFNF